MFPAPRRTPMLRPRGLDGAAALEPPHRDARSAKLRKWVPTGFGTPVVL